MKFFLALVAVVPWLALTQVRPSQETVILISGNLSGYLSPCGCTTPMEGGIRRLGSAIKAHQIPGRTLFLVNGPLTAGFGRQDELKLESAAEAYGSLGISAINYSRTDAKLGPGSLEALTRFTKNRVVGREVQPLVRQNGFAIYGLRSGDPTPVFEPKSIVLFEGPRDSAMKLAKDNPKVKLVVYVANSQFPPLPSKVGHTWIVASGEKGKRVLKLTLKGDLFTSYQIISLGPEWTDDAAMGRIFSRYQTRIDREGLLDLLPRRNTPEYAGSLACRSCHEETYKIWSKTQHSTALSTLEKVGQARDPDCVSCHVVGLESRSGFVNRSFTNDLANVGCESCHGPAKAHSMAPSENPMQKVGAKSCAPCHNPAHSPKFDYNSYWEKVRH